MFTKIKNWVSYHHEASIGIGIGLGVVLITTLLFVLFYEPPVSSGTITNMNETSDKVAYRQEQEAHYRYITQYRPVTKHTTDGNGHTRNYTTTESYQVRIFDHYEYVIYKDFDGANYTVTIETPSEKHPGKMRSAVIYVTHQRYTETKNQGYNTFTVDKVEGDRRYDFNNTVEEMDRQWYNPFNLDDWMKSHNVRNSL